MPRAKSTSAAPESKGKPYSKPSSSSKGKSPAPAAGAKKKSKNPTNKKQGAWSSDELKALYDVMCPKRVSVFPHPVWTQTSIHQPLVLSVLRAAVEGMAVPFTVALDVQRALQRRL